MGLAASGSIRPKLMPLVTSKDIRQDLLPKVSFKRRALIIMTPSLQFQRRLTKDNHGPCSSF